MMEAAIETPPAPAVQAVFDAHGRCVPGALSAPVHERTRRYFTCTQPEVDYKAIHARLARHLGGAERIGAREFETRARGVLASLEADEVHRGITNAVHVPFYLPAGGVADVGAEIERTYIPAVQAAYEEAFPGRDFENRCVHPLDDRLTAADQGRHRVLLERLAEGPVVGVFFVALTEYSVPAARERVERLPEKFLMAGGLDTCAAAIGSPGLLFREEGYPPVLWFGGLESDAPDANYHLEQYGFDLTLNRRVHLGNAAESWANGIVVLG